MDKVIVSFSGGLDSTVLVYYLISIYGAQNVICINFSYGQKNGQELECAHNIANDLGVSFHVQSVDLSQLASVSSLLAASPLKLNHVKDTLGLPQTVEYVPYRNLLFASYLFGYCEKLNANLCAMGFQSVDEYGFWDCTEPFVESLNQISNLNRIHDIKFIAPFRSMEKWEIVKLGLTLKVPFEKTRSCYSNSDEACGTCAACSIRLKAFLDNSYMDPVQYAIR